MLKLFKKKKHKPKRYMNKYDQRIYVTKERKAIRHVLI